MAILGAGCGSDVSAGTSADAGTTPQPGGTLRIAIGSEIETLDPLLASTRAEHLAARQLYEPLVSHESGPFGQARRLPGLARSLKPAAGGMIWIARLRGGVRFGDGEAMDADAVIANAQRWMEVAPGPDLVPELSAVDSPRPGMVRFQLDQPTPRFPRQLQRGELGLVAPGALEKGSGQLRLGAGGSGPFELREREPGRTLLARNASWWGTRLGLGPGVDQLELLEVKDPAARGDGLAAGSVEVADDLDPATTRAVSDDPLLTTVGGAGATLGLERSVRGIETAADDQPLADAWLTDLR